ncbi:MAG: TIGR04211 family SH3 domain-containing protein [Gemmatimonadetes bacterium]|nr:TIGR04211 family SH3 domain-containing protein [Gemmatimonadota bacterium]
MIAWLLGIALALATVMATGQTLFVSDQLVITVRTGSSTENTILANLVSGDAVQVLQADGESGYTRIRTESGTEGWVLSRYLVERPISQDRLVIAERGLAEAQVRIATLERSVATSTEALKDTSRRLEEAETANAALTTDLADLRDASANVLNIVDQNDSVRRRLNESNEEVDLLRIENDQLRSGSTRDWFFAGAGVLLVGILVGLIAPRLRRRRRSSW